MTLTKKWDEIEFNRRLGQRICEMREAAGLSQLQLGSHLAVHPNTVSNYERGMGVPLAVFIRICGVTNTDAAKTLAEVING